MEGLLLLASPLILILVLFFAGKALIRLFTGKTTAQWTAERDAKKLDHQMEMAAYQHRLQVQAADRYIKKNGTAWLEGR